MHMHAMHMSMIVIPSLSSAASPCMSSTHPCHTYLLYIHIRDTRLVLVAFFVVDVVGVDGGESLHRELFQFVTKTR